MRVRHLQLSRSRAVSTHSHARGPPPKTPQAAQPGPMSVHEPLPTQERFFFLLGGWLEGHAPAAWQMPLQMAWGGLQTQLVGFAGGSAVKPSVQVKLQGLPLMQVGVLCSG